MVELYCRGLIEREAFFMSQIESILELIAAHDTYAVVDRLAREADALTSGKAFVEVMRHLYWQKKDMHRSVQIAQAGAHCCLTVAARDGLDPTQAMKLRGIAKGLTYDIASFTWPGWNEPGITISATDLALGMDAARANLRMARELNRGDLPMSRAHWMLAGHRLCSKEFAAAKDDYQSAARYATAAGSKSDELLSQGFACLTDILAGTTPSASADLDAILQQLNAVEGGPDFAQQILTAKRVFGQ
jgi:hypothetical protein